MRICWNYERKRKVRYVFQKTNDKASGAPYCGTNHGGAGGNGGRGDGGRGRGIRGVRRFPGGFHQRLNHTNHGSSGYRRSRHIGPVPGQGAAQGCQEGSRTADSGDHACFCHHCRHSSCRGTPAAGRHIWKSGTGRHGQCTDLFLDHSPVISLYRTLQCLRSPVPFHGQLKGIHDDFLCHEYD